MVVHCGCVVSRRPGHACGGEAGGQTGWVAEVEVAFPGDDQDVGADVAEAGVVFDEGRRPRRCERKAVAAQAADPLPHRPARAGQRGEVICGQIGGNPLPHAGIEAEDAVSDAAEDRPADAPVACKTRSPIMDPTEYPARSTWSSPR